MLLVVLREANSGRCATSVVAESSAERRAISAPSLVGTSVACRKSAPCWIASSKALRVSTIRSSAAPPSAMIAGCRSSA
jgi:hypothetical protein